MAEVEHMPAMVSLESDSVAGHFVDDVLLHQITGFVVGLSPSSDSQLIMLPILWQEAFGSTPLLRWGPAFLGGVVLMFGARLAGGCTSGHGISGTLQLVLSSWIALLCFFVGGVITASLIY